MGRSITAALSVFILAGLMVLNPVYADDVSHVLALYGYDEPLNIEKEKTVLDKLLDEYYTLSKKVSNIEMSQIAKSINEEQYPLSLALQEKDVIEKETNLHNVESTIFKNSEAPVEYLLSLEAEYLKAEMDLKDSRAQLEQLKKEKPEEYREVSNAKQLKVELTKKDIIVKNQKSKVKEAASFPEIGEKRIKQYPLDSYSYITSDFGKRIDPISKEATQFHTGIDLHANIDTKVTCAYNGTVEKVGFDKELGNFVIVDHGKGLRTIYGHLKSYTVKTGDSIAQYQHIAYSGDSGSRSTGPHLHFGVYINGEPVNPNIIIKR